MSRKKLIGIIGACIVVIALIVALARPGIEPALAIVDRAEGITAVSGEVDFSVSMPDKDEAQVQVLLKDEFTGQPVEGISVELVVTATTLEVLFHDPQGDYLPGIFVFDQDKLDEYSEIRTENPIIITLLAATVLALKTAGLALFVKGGITIMAGGTVSIAKSALTGLAISLAAEGLWAVTKHLATPVSPKDTINYPITIYVFEEPEGEYATHTIKVLAGATWEEMDDAVRGITGDIEVQVVWPAKNPAGAYYYPDGTPKVLYVYPEEEAVQAEYTLAISSTAGGSVVTPGEGTFTYDAGAVVSLVASPVSGYRFVNWTGNVGTIAVVNAASTTITMQGYYAITANFAEAEAGTFCDPNLEAAVREAIGKPTGPIYRSDLEGLTSLDASSRNISELTGLEHCVNLTVLDLQGNRISDISPLSSLSNLTALRLEFNQISDISPIANLTKLTILLLSANQISDISPLVKNDGLSEGDRVCLRWNRLSSDSMNIYLPQLKARGVIIRHDLIP